MLKEFVQYLLEMNRPEIVEHAGDSYSTRNLHKLNVESDVETIEARSLSGLVDYVRSHFDTSRDFMIHVESPTSVSVYDALNDDYERRKYLKATAMLPNIIFDRFIDTESFNIQLQSKFVKTDDSAKLMALLGNIVQDGSVNTVDDGVSQRVTTKTGVATRGDVVLPNPVDLKPIRTFVEIDQPESSFVLRLQEGPKAALFEADGAAWEINAMHNIKEYLHEELKDLVESEQVTIIA